MATVTAKFRVNSVTDYGPNAGKAVMMTPVTGGSDENKSFWSATPNGKFEMTVTNDEASKHFKAGQEVYIDFRFPDA